MGVNRRARDWCYETDCIPQATVRVNRHNHVFGGDYARITHARGVNRRASSVSFRNRVFPTHVGVNRSRFILRS
jgi:hypothetical protein